jgi:archaellum component FlaC
MHLAEAEELANQSLQHFSDDEETKDSLSQVTSEATAEDIAAKNDELEQIRDTLEKEREKLHEQQKLVADLREELQIKEGLLQ